MPTMYPDPVVQEIRDHAEQIAAECDGDVDRMAERFRCEQQAHPARSIRRGDAAHVTVNLGIRAHGESRIHPPRAG